MYVVNGTKVKKKKKSKFFYMSIIVVFLGIIMGVQLCSLAYQNYTYKKQEALLTKELEKQQDKSSELSKYEEYINTDEYTESMARSKGGLVKPNEIIFRERKK